MHRLLVLIVPTLCTVSLYGNPTCAATASLMVGETLYPLTLVGDATDCVITGTAIGGGYVISVNASTHSDPVIDFGMNFDGSGTDPLVQLMISTPYSGGPYSTISITGSGTLTDSDRSGSASVQPLSGDIEIVKVNGSTIYPSSPVNPGCSFTGQVAGFSQACPLPTLTQVSGSFLASGALETDLVFVLSAGDSYNVTGSASFDSVPEPAGAGVLLGAGFLAMAGLARRRRLS